MYKITINTNDVYGHSVVICNIKTFNTNSFKNVGENYLYEDKNTITYNDNKLDILIVPILARTTIKSVKINGVESDNNYRITKSVDTDIIVDIDVDTDNISDNYTFFAGCDNGSIRLTTNDIVSESAGVNSPAMIITPQTSGLTTYLNNDNIINFSAFVNLVNGVTVVNNNSRLRGPGFWGVLQN